MLNVGGKRMLASEELLPASEGGKPASFERRGFQSLEGRHLASGQGGPHFCPLPPCHWVNSPRVAWGSLLLASLAP